MKVKHRWLQKRLWTVYHPSKKQSLFLDALASSPTESGVKPVILAMSDKHCDSYIPTSLAVELLVVLTELYKLANLTIGYTDLL